jgi:hypothetical protein
MAVSLVGSLVSHRASPLRSAPSRANARRNLVVRMGPPLPTPDLHARAKGPIEAPVTLSAWLDYACPFSAKLFKTVTTQVLPHYGDKVRFVFYHQPQPWHPQSSMLHEAAIGVYHLGGVDAFWKFSAALFDAATDFYDANTYDKSRSKIYEEARADREGRRAEHGQRVHAGPEVLRQAGTTDGNPRVADDAAERYGVRHVLGVEPGPVEGVPGPPRRRVNEYDTLRVSTSYNRYSRK